MISIRSRLVTAAIFVGFVVATVARGTGPFRWDAAHYWAATQAMVGAIPAFPEGYWELRGVFTPFIYSPAAALTSLVGDQFASYAVLLQNSVVLGVAAVFLLPAVVGFLRTVSPLMRFVGALLMWIVTSGFAAYPLVDLYSALGILGLIALLRSHQRWVLFLAGIVAGVTMNIRPAYLVVVVALVVVVVIWRRGAGIFLPAGVAIALIPQTVVSAFRSGVWSPLPSGSADLIALQSGYASYTVRYDTIIGDASARQFFCSPEMASRVGESPPQSAGELAVVFLQSIPTSLVFSFEKIAASLAWHGSVPYSAPARPIDVAFGIGITAIAVMGIVALFFAAFRGVEGKRDGYAITVLATIIAGSVLTLAGSATETRFALILVLVGVVGLTVIVGAPPTGTRRSRQWWIVAAVLATVVVYIGGAIGLGHPAPRGDVTTSICESA
jgi:hypothetical protein